MYITKYMYVYKIKTIQLQYKIKKTEIFENLLKYEKCHKLKREYI